ncbi:MAG: hypothetical protein IPM39_04560 [Chloroflexi bacterium]|nr:hypothetical protein [Chloroflexota bacterium]
MNQPLQRNLNLLLNQVTNELGLDPFEAKIFLQKYLIDMSLPSQSGFDETVKIVRDSKSDVVLATSLKIPNLRFKLGEVLLEIYRTGVLFFASKDNHHKQLLIGLDFLRKIRQLSTITISEQHANLLVMIFKLAQTETKVTVDAVQELLIDVQDGRIASGLSELEKLGCINVTMGEIKLNETIDVISQSK